MSAPTWEPVGASERMHTAKYTFSAGVSRTTIVHTKGGAHIVYSPGKGLEQSARELIGDGGEVLLLAPSAAHLLGLEAWQKQFPEARVVGARSTAARVKKKTAVREVHDLEVLRASLDAHTSLHMVPQCRSGEAWLRVDADDRSYWVVCDGVMNLTQLPEKAWLRIALQLYGLRIGLHVTPIFKWGALRDRTAFRSWATEKFANTEGCVLVPCHGDIVEAPDLNQQLVELIDRRL